MYGMRMYTLSIQGTMTAAGGDCDIVSFLPDAARGIVITSAKFTVGTAELAETADEAWDIALVYGNTTVGSGGSSVLSSIEPLDESNSIAHSISAARAFDTTPASAGTAHVLDRSTPPERNEYRFEPIPIEMPKVVSAVYVCFRLMTAVADDITVTGTVKFGEPD